MTSIFSFMKRGPAQPANDPLAAQRARIKGFKEESLERASTEAHAEGRMPTLTDYFIACEMLGAERRGLIADEHLHWGPKVYTDLSGLTIDGFLIRREDLTPPADMRLRASANAKELAKYQGRTPTMLDYLRAMKSELDKSLPVQKVS